MQFKTILSVLSVAIAATARPNPSPAKSTSTCSSPSTLACCNGISSNGTGIGCIISTLNIVPVCTQTLACCTGGDVTQTGLVDINLGCIAIGSIL